MNMQKQFEQCLFLVKQLGKLICEDRDFNNDKCVFNISKSVDYLTQAYADYWIAQPKEKKPGRPIKFPY